MKERELKRSLFDAYYYEIITALKSTGIKELVELVDHRGSKKDFLLRLTEERFIYDTLPETVNYKAVLDVTHIRDMAGLDETAYLINYYGSWHVADGHTGKKYACWSNDIYTEFDPSKIYSVIEIIRLSDE